MTREEFKIMQARLESHGIRQPIETASRVIRESLSGLAGSNIHVAHEQPQSRAPEAPDSSASVFSQSSLEVKFFDLWTACRGPSLRCQYKFCEERYWRADFAHLESKTLIEIDGGVWLPGGHNKSGKVRDCLKDFEAILNGWRVVRLVPQQIKVENIERLIAFVKGNP